MSDVLRIPLVFGFAPALNKISDISMLSIRAAICTGVAQCTEDKFGSAPLSKSYRTISVCAPRTARPSGISLLLTCLSPELGLISGPGFISAPRWINRLVSII